MRQLIQFIQEHWILSVTVGVSVIVVVIGAILVQINRSPNGLEANNADKIYSFFNDWSATLGAAATILLAIIALSTILHTSRQVKLMTQQRRDSIRPFLQLDRIWPVLHQTAITQFVPPLQLKNPQIRYIISPSMQVDISNLGSGAAVRLNIFGYVVLELTNTTTNERFLRTFHFELPKQGGDQYIEPKKDKPRTIELDFSHHEVPDSTKAAGIAEYSLTYYDVDGNLFRERRFHQLVEEAYLREIDGSVTMPGDLDYPEELLSPPS